MQGRGTDLYGCTVTKALLKALIVVKMDVICNCSSKGDFICKLIQIEHLSLYNAPEPLDRTVINAMTNTGHRLFHLLSVQLHLKGGTGILESSVAVKQWPGSWISSNRFVKGTEYQFVVIVATQYIGDDGTVI